MVGGKPSIRFFVVPDKQNKRVKINQPNSCPGTTLSKHEAPDWWLKIILRSWKNQRVKCAARHARELALLAGLGKAKEFRAEIAVLIASGCGGSFTYRLFISWPCHATTMTLVKKQFVPLIFHFRGKPVLPNDQTLF